MANIRKTFNFRNGVQVDDDNLIVNPTGLVGIGTTVPTQALDVRGGANFVGLLSATSGLIDTLTVTNLIVNGNNFTSGTVGSGVSVLAGVITASTSTGIVTYYGDGKYLLNLPNSQWVDIDVGLGFTSIYGRGWVGVQTNDPRYPFQVGGALINGSIAGGVGIGSTGDIHATGIITSGKGFRGDIEGDISAGLSTLGVANATSLNATGVVTASTFSGALTGNVVGDVTGNLAGNVTGNVYATGVSTFGDIKVTSGDITISQGIVTATSFSGDFIGQVNNTVGVSTITQLNTSQIDATGGQILTGIITATSSNIGVTTTTDLKANQLGIGINPRGKQIEIFTVGISTVDITGTEESRIIFGNQSGTANGIGASTGLIRYGNEEKSLDIANNDSGDINYHLNLSGQSVGVGTTGSYNWYHKTSDLLMTLSPNGNLGINNPNPEFPLHVTGIASISNNLTVEGDLTVAGNIGGNIQVNELNGNVNATTGVSTFYDITVNHVADLNSVGIGTTQPLANIGLDARTETILANNIGIGTTAASVALQVNGAGIVNHLGIGSYAGPDGLLVHQKSSVFNRSDVGLSSCNLQVTGNSQLFFDNEAAIGIGTTSVRSVLDFGEAGVGAGATGIRFMIPPMVSGTQRVGLNTQRGAFIYNTDTNTLQIYNGSTWLAQATGGATSLDALTDVNLSTPQNTQILQFNGTNWTNASNSVSGLTDTTITSAVEGDTLTYNGSAWVNDHSVTVTTTATTQTNLHQLAVATYRSGEYLIQATQGTNFQLVKILAIHDGTSVAFTEFGTLKTGSDVASYTMDVSGGNMRLRATPASANSTVFKVKFTAIKV